jgi:glycosyltransferase involved in cell wall biosynthesis
VDVLSHTPALGKWSPIPTISWIPDFQERHLPDFFSAEEIARREDGHRSTASAATFIIVSSHHAQRDLAGLFPQAKSKSRVLQFVSGVGGERVLPTAAELTARYAIEGPFFYLPNQFWIHKNHRVVVEALALLKSRGRNPTVICTGHTGDYRHPRYFAELMHRVAEAGVNAGFRVEGLVPFDDVAAFMRHCVAVINPSSFEGWSTTVEESKSLGKCVLLSDIEVHREQAPERGRFFDLHEPAQLAQLMEAALDAYSPQQEDQSQRRAALALPSRLRVFADAYQTIVLEAAALKPNRKRHLSR